MAYRRTGPSSVIDSLGSPLDDEPVGRLPVARLVSLGRHAPWRHGMTSARGLAFTAAERMIHRVHRHAADVRALAAAAAPAPFRPAGSTMSRISPSAYLTRAIRADRFGSYSTVATTPGMPFLSRLKSITRYIRLCAPPRHHTVISPWLLRPPDRCSGSTSGLLGARGRGPATT